MNVTNTQNILSKIRYIMLSTNFHQPNTIHNIRSHCNFMIFIFEMFKYMKMDVKM